MPRRKKSKSQAIRETLQQHPKASAKEIVEKNSQLLAQAGIAASGGNLATAKRASSGIRVRR